MGLSHKSQWPPSSRLSFAKTMSSTESANLAQYVITLTESKNYGIDKISLLHIRLSSAISFTQQGFVHTVRDASSFTRGKMARFLIRFHSHPTLSCFKTVLPSFQTISPMTSNLSNKSPSQLHLIIIVSKFSRRWQEREGGKRWKWRSRSRSIKSKMHLLNAPSVRMTSYLKTLNQPQHLKSLGLKLKNPSDQRDFP